MFQIHVHGGASADLCPAGMFAIEAIPSNPRRWVSALLCKRAAAEAFLSSVPAAGRGDHKPVALPVQADPVFIIEKQGFQYGDPGVVRAMLKRLGPLTPAGGAAPHEPG